MTEPEPTSWRTRPAEAWLYPGRLVSRPVVLTPTGSHPLWGHRGAPAADLDQSLTALGGTPMAHRTLVLAMGSNGSLAVLRHKLTRAGVSAVVPLVPGVVVGIAAGHSAHVSTGGYIAAAPYHASGGATRVVAGWFDPDQVRALDRSEPNYRRAWVSASQYPVTLVGQRGPARYAVYRSVWGVLGHRGHVLALRSQRALHRVLASDPVLSDVLAADTDASVGRLMEPGVQRAVREHWARTGRALPDGLRVVRTR